MKKQYVKPSIALVVMEDICSNGINIASVQKPDQSHVDSFEVVEEEQSKNDYDWSMDSWGGN